MIGNDIMPPNQRASMQSQGPMPQPSTPQGMPMPAEMPQNTPQTTAQQAPQQVMQASQMFQPDNFTLNPETNTAQAPKPKKSKKGLLIVLFVMVLMAGAATAGYFLVLNKEDSTTSTQQKTVSLEQKDEVDGMTFTKLSSDESYINLKDTPFKSTKGIFVYSGQKSNKSLTTSISGVDCDLEDADLLQYDAGILVLKGVLSASLGSVTVDSLVNLYKNAGATSEKVNVGGVDLAKIADGGNGVSASCSVGSDKLTKSLDVKQSYIYVAEDGSDYFISLAQTKNSVNGVEVDSALSSETFESYTETQLLDFVSHFIKNN